MPRKIREYKAELTVLGFTERKGKGSHKNWKHPKLKLVITIAGKNGDDVPLYLEKQLRQAIKQLETDS